MKKVTVFLLVFTGIVFYSCAPRVYRNTPPSSPTPTPTPQKEPPAPVQPEQPQPGPLPSVSLNTLTAKEKADGWQLLFDGLDTDGWHAYGSRTIGTAWKVANGELYVDNNKDGESKSGGDIITDKEYGNFELQIDWKIDRAGNSGICFYIHEDKAKYNYMWATGPEIQIVDNEGHPDGRIFKHQAGDLYDLQPAKSHAEHSPLQWNHYLIRCVNGKLDVYLNDVQIITTQLWDDNWRNMIANSKFKDAYGFGTYRIGHIGLQDHGNNVWFRNIKIKAL